MPRQITATTSFWDLKMEIFFTRAALQADPDAHDLLGRTDGWLLRVEAAEKQMLENLAERMLVDAERVVANNRLDYLCLKFSTNLEAAVLKDRTSVRWKRYLDEQPTRFVRQPLQDQVSDVNGWLATQDPVLEPLREGLTLWSAAAQKALNKEPMTRQKTADLHQLREDHAALFTRERDALERELAIRADARELGRDWSGGFFLKS